MFASPFAGDAFAALNRPETTRNPCASTEAIHAP
jgi:hypothetical protein